MNLSKLASRRTATCSPHRQAVAARGGPGVSAAPSWEPRGPRRHASERGEGASAGASWTPGTPAFWGSLRPAGSPAWHSAPRGGHADVPSPASSLALTSGSAGWHGFITLSCFLSLREVDVLLGKFFNFLLAWTKPLRFPRPSFPSPPAWEAHSACRQAPANALRVEQTGLPDKPPPSQNAYEGRGHNHGQPSALPKRPLQSDHKFS